MTLRSYIDLEIEGALALHGADVTRSFVTACAEYVEPWTAEYWRRKNRPEVEAAVGLALSALPRGAGSSLAAARDSLVTVIPDVEEAGWNLRDAIAQDALLCIYSAVLVASGAEGISAEDVASHIYSAADQVAQWRKPGANERELTASPPVQAAFGDLAFLLKSSTQNAFPAFASFRAVARYRGYSWLKAHLEL